MTRSMTGYGRALFSSEWGHGTVEIHCVNRKGLELSVQLPKELLFLDMDIRKKLSCSVERGQVTLRLTLSDDLPSLSQAEKVVKLKAMKQMWEGVCTELGLGSGAITLPFLLAQWQQMPVSISSEEEEEFKRTLFGAIDQAIAAFLKMKNVEGELLAADITQRLAVIERDAEAVSKEKEAPVMAYKKKISEKLDEIGFLDEDLKNRIAKEVAIFAEKMDITEEIVRLRAHIGQFREHLFSNAASIGRVLDFLSQELHREMNTIGSKIQDRSISCLVISMKSELDRIREQVQNIE